MLGADRRLAADVEFHQRRRESMREKRRDAADGARFAVDVEQRHVALGRGVELQDLRNPEALLEVAPDVGPQAVAAGHPDPVLHLARGRRGVQQVAAQLADVLHERAVPADDVAPELTGGESVAHDHRTAADQHRAGRLQAADAVIHRQAAVHPVVRANVHQAGEPVARLHQSVMMDPRGLGWPRRARRVDIERPVLDGRRPALGRAQRLARAAADVAVEAREVVAAGGAVSPDRGRPRQVPPRGGEGTDELGGHDDMPGRDQVDAMREGAAGQLRVEQRHDAADPGDAEPDRHVLGSARHEQTDGVAWSESLIERPARIAIGLLGQRTIGQALALGQQGRRRVEALGELVDHRRQRALRAPADRRRQLERAPPRLGGAGGRAIGGGALAAPRRRQLGQRRLHAVLPASTVSTVPVMLLAPAPRRNSTASATSSMSGRRRSALRRAIC